MLPAILKTVKLELINEFTCRYIKNLFHLNVDEQMILHAIKIIKESNPDMHTVGDLLEQVKAEDIMKLVQTVAQSQDAQVTLKGENMCACPHCGHISRLDEYMPKFFGKE